jgi:hypothetical protein
VIKRSEVKLAQVRAAEMLSRVGITLTGEEQKNIEVAEFGLNDLKKTGLE